VTDRHIIRPLALLAGALFSGALLTLAGCTSGGSDDRSDKGSTSAAEDDRSPVVAPGRPGEDADTLTPDEAEAAANAQYPEPNPADISFVSMMVVHHQQALEMTELAEQHAEDLRVQRLAGRIAAAQTPEIAVMETWLDQHEPHRAHHDGQHDHADMPGMAGPDQLADLAEARGGDFDRLFLELMIVHHEGAVTMSADVLSDGTEPLAAEMATEIGAQQTAEVTRMRTMLDDL
jgi:uncharacterized protein (DUF305 family)